MTNAAGADLAGLQALALCERLSLFGALATCPEDGIGTGTLALLGPAEPGFWRHIRQSPEFRDGKADPMDRWSLRVISALAREMGGTALFPFGTPVRPFFSWALRSGRAWQSPVALLVHDTAGLMVSYHGAVLLPGACPKQPEPPSPCAGCATQPCRSACPAGALTGAGYDLDTCHAYLDTGPGAVCMSQGCEVRRACPISKNYGRSEEQSAYHMSRFHPCR